MTMLTIKTNLLLLFLIQLSSALASSLVRKDNVTFLRQVLFVHRDGDHTPMNFPLHDEIKKEDLWKFYGYGQLTNEGKRRIFQLGQLTRQRYDKFIGGSVDKNDRFTRTSQVKRCMESGQLFLASFLALDQSKDLVWDNTTLAQQWQPASMASVPVKFDGMLSADTDCNLMKKEIDKINNSKEFHHLLEIFNHEIGILEYVYKIQIKTLLNLTDILDTILVESKYFEDKLPAEAVAIMDRMEVAKTLAFIFLQSTLKLRRFQGGLLMSDLVRNMVAMRNQSQEAKKFLHYSTQNTIVTVLLGMLDSWPNLMPDYGGNVALELYQENEYWYVRAFYMDKVPSEPKELKLAGCLGKEDRCTLDNFQKMMEPYLFINWLHWFAECGNYLTKIDPYEASS